MGEGWLVLGFVLAVIASAVSLGLYRRRFTVSIVSEAERQRERPETDVVMSTRPDPWKVAERYQRMIQSKMTRALDENAKLKAEIERLKIEAAKSKEFTEGQRVGVREYLERDLAGKAVTRTTITKILGKDSTKGFVLIGEELEKLEQKQSPPKPVLQHQKA